MRGITADEALRLNRILTDQTGGAFGLRDMGGLESTVAQPMMLNHPFLGRQQANGPRRDGIVVAAKWL